MVKEHYDVKSLICVIDKEDIDMDYIEGESCIRLSGFLEKRFMKIRKILRHLLSIFYGTCSLT